MGNPQGSKSQTAPHHMQSHPFQAPMPTLTLPTQASSSDVQHEACIVAFIHEFLSQNEDHSPSTSLEYAITHTNIQALAKGLSEILNRNLTPELLGFQQNPGALRQQSTLSILGTATKLHIQKMSSIFIRLGSEIKEITIGNASFSVTLGTGHMEDSCYIEYVQSRARWRVAVCPSGIPLRVVEESELTQGCQQLVSLAGCCFKTAASTPPQSDKPLEVPSRSLRNVMQSLGFCTADTESLYRVYTSRFGRSIKATVTVVAKVDHNGDNQKDEVHVEGNLLKASVEVLDKENVINVVYRFKKQSDNSLITRQGREMVRRKLSGHNSVVLM